MKLRHSSRAPIFSGLSILSLSIFAAIGLTTATAFSAPESDTEVAARKAALDLAGAFSNEGFKMRDGHWSGTIKPKEHALIAVNLYAGNQYWFSVGATEAAKKIAVNVYDETGKLVQTEDYNEGEKAAAGFSPTSSGQYYVLVDLVEGSESSVCLVYSYK
ncbi:MAG TPA: hypothetical protein VNW72_01865 [Chthoniobacterales bacterium]|jgi:hypothetical protein|nr:hypothetical protein [Chthoniobacterales bacterium]